MNIHVNDFVMIKDNKKIGKVIYINPDGKLAEVFTDIRVWSNYYKIEDLLKVN